MTGLILSLSARLPVPPRCIPRVKADGSNWEVVHQLLGPMVSEVPVQEKCHLWVLEGRNGDAEVSILLTLEAQGLTVDPCPVERWARLDPCPV